MVWYGVSACRFLFALGIPHIGALTAELLADEFHNDSTAFLACLHALRNSAAAGEERDDVDVDEGVGVEMKARLLAVPGVGGTVVQALKDLAGKCCNNHLQLGYDVLMRRLIGLFCSALLY